MIRLLVIGLVIIVFTWILNNYSNKNKLPLSERINPALRLLFVLLLLLMLAALLPKFGLNPLKFIQKLAPLIGLI